MNNYIKVTNNKGLVRDMESKAILTVDNQSLHEHRKNKHMLKEMIDNSNKIESLEKDIKEIKEMLLNLTSSKRMY